MEAQAEYARLIAPFFDEIRTDLSVIRTDLYAQRYNFGRLSEQVDADQKALSDIIARLDSSTEAFVKGVKPIATGAPVKDKRTLAMKYQLACEVTGTEAIISGGRHRLVKKANGMSFFMDDFFIDVLNGINDKGLVERVKARYGVTEEYIPEGARSGGEERVRKRNSRGRDGVGRQAGFKGTGLMAKIMHVNHLYSLLAGGATILADSLCRRFEGDDVSVFSGDFNEGPLYSISASEIDRIKIRSVNLTGVYGDYKGALWDGFDEKNYCNPVIGSAFREYLEEVKPGIVHFHSLQWLGANLVEEAAKFGAKTVLTMHDWWWVCAQQFLVSPDGRTCPLYETDHSCYCRSRKEYEKRVHISKGF